ncbi:hypothetical protein ACIQUW_33245 [Streptomyces sp. NPDC101117]|uniref:hypothetical protein n=1 Tax=Streptomyces sp. NPDC101117 TaxID=3366108 RepID=UPI0038100666
MSISPAELAALPTAPTVSSALNDAARYTGDGAILALSRAVYGSTNPDDYVVLASPEHTLAWGMALVAAARTLDPAVASEWPDATWNEDLWADTVFRAHKAVTAWVDGQDPTVVADLFRAAARDIRSAEK